MKFTSLVIFGLAVFMPIFSATAQDDDNFDGTVAGLDQAGDEGFGTGEGGLQGGEEEFGLSTGESGPDDEDVIPEGRILGAAPAFGLGLLGGHVGSTLIRNVGSFLGLRKPSLPPLFRPPPAAAFYPAPYVPAGYPYPSYPGGFPGRSSLPLKGGKGVPSPQVPLAAPFAPIPIPVAYYRSNDDDDDQDENTDSFDNETQGLENETH